MTWLERVDQLLYAGEREERRVAVGDATIVVTTHRVLAFTPGSGDRPRFRQVARPNVDSVEVASSGRLEYLLRTALLVVVASIAAVVAVLFSFRDLVPDLEAGPDGESGVDGAPGADVAGETLGLVETTFALVDVAVLSTAVLAGLAACWYAVQYVRSRDRRLVLEVYGDDDVEIPIDTVGVAAIELQDAIDPERALSEASSAATSGAPARTTHPGQSTDALESDGESPPETGADPAVDAYGVRADASSRSRSHSSGSRNESSVLESPAETDASGEETEPFGFGDRTDEPQANASEAVSSVDDSLESPPDDPFESGADEDDYVDPFDDLDDSSDDPAAFVDTEDEHAGPADDLEWGSETTAPDWATGADAAERDDEVIDLSAAGSGPGDEAGAVGDGFDAGDDAQDGGERAGGESVTDDESVIDGPAADADSSGPDPSADADSSDRDPSGADANDRDDAADANDPDNTDDPPAR